MWHSIIAIAETTPKIAINYDYHQSSKILNNTGLSLAYQSLIYDSHRDQKWISKKIS